ncbi:PilN domain-containing protein [Providencia alcalifaciens]|uniref:PilN domain-containing protein n=1 Tax=Providencia alcalifaciens TaxID=126385 RepID=UPI002B056B08|nr:PilN domain-containing protein [Providencia alcalifaciens]
MYQVNFLPWRADKLTRQRRYFLMVTGLSCISVIVIFGYLISLLLEDISQAHLYLAAQQKHQQHIEQLKTQLQAQQQQLEKFTLQQNQRQSYTQHNHALLSLLRSLSNLTPPKSWLSTFQLREGRLEIKALSYRFQDLNLLLTQFSQTPQVDNVQLRTLRRVAAVNQLHLTADYRGVINE